MHSMLYHINKSSHILIQWKFFLLAQQTTVLLFSTRSEVPDLDLYFLPDRFTSRANSVQNLYNFRYIIRMEYGEWKFDNPKMTLKINNSKCLEHFPVKVHRRGTNHVTYIQYHMPIIPSQYFKSWAPHVEHCEEGFGSPNLGSVTSLTASIAITDIFSCYSMTMLKRFIDFVKNISQHFEIIKLINP